MQLVGSLDPDIRVVRNDEVTVDEILRMHPDHLTFSFPGPGRPAESGICEQAVQELAGVMPILGVAWDIRPSEGLGAVICRAEQLMHGKQSLSILPTAAQFFRGLSR